MPIVEPLLPIVTGSSSTTSVSGCAWPWADFFEDFDLLLCPTAASTAFPHDHEGERPERMIIINGRPEPAPDQLFWAGLTSTVYLPSTVAPAGLTKAGLPCGMQVVAPHLGDRASIAFARMMETELGGFTAPPRCQ